MYISFVTPSCALCCFAEVEVEGEVEVEVGVEVEVEVGVKVEGEVGG